MTTRFTVGGIDYDYITDGLVISAPDARGDYYEFVDGTTALDVRWVRLSIEVVGVWEQVGGPELSAFGLWREIQADPSALLLPDLTSALNIFLPVTATLTPPQPWSVSKGVLDRRQSLRLRATNLYAPTDPFLDEIGALTLPL